MFTSRILVLCTVLFGWPALAGSAPGTSPPKASAPRVWVRVPTSSEHGSFNLMGIRPEDVMPPGSLLTCMIGALSEDDVRALGRPQGVMVNSLSPKSCDLLKRALANPLVVRTRTVRDAGTAFQPHPILVSSGGVDARDIPWDRVNIRAYLQMPNLELTTVEGAQTSVGIARQMPGKFLALGIDAPTVYTNLQKHIVKRTPFSPKASDLRAADFPQRYPGALVNEVITVAEALESVQKTTGRSFRADARIAERAFSIGVADPTCGEVLHNLALLVDGAYRKVGDVFLLTWDRRGLGAVQQTLYLNAIPLMSNVQRLTVEQDSAMAWAYMARDLPFDPQGLVLTQSQRNRIFSIGLEELKTHGLPFSTLTPAQQSIIRTLVRAARMPLPGVASAASRPVSDEDLTNASLTSGARVILELFLPNHGWVSLEGIAPTYFHAGNVTRAYQTARIKKEQGSRNAVEIRGSQPLAGIVKYPPNPPPSGLRDVFPDPWRSSDPIVRLPLAVDAPERAAMLPPMPTERLRVIAGRMKKQGLNTLYYPVLFGGYATLPTGAFPRHPGEVSSLAQAAQIASDNGLNLIGYLNTLSWQSLGQGQHWLDAHPDWWDVDIQGETRLEWLRKHPNAVPSPSDESTILSGYVSPLVPDVTERLERLVTDLASDPGLDGLAFADWTGLAEAVNYIDPREPEKPSRLGYHVLERLAELESTGIDAVDESLYPRFFQPATFLESGQPENPSPQMQNFVTRRANLVSRLSAISRKSAPDRKIVVICDARTMSLLKEDGLGADRIVSTDLYRTISTPQGLLAPVVPRFGGPTTLKARMAFANMRIKSMLSYRPNAKAVVWDFRAYPDQLEEALLWIAPPGTPGATGGFAVW